MDLCTIWKNIYKGNIKIKTRLLCVFLKQNTKTNSQTLKAKPGKGLGN